MKKLLRRLIVWALEFDPEYRMWSFFYDGKRTTVAIKNKFPPSYVRVPQIPEARIQTEDTPPDLAVIDMYFLTDFDIETRIAIYRSKKCQITN